MPQLAAHSVGATVWCAALSAALGLSSLPAEKWLPRESSGVNVIMKSKGAKLDAPINILSYSFAALMDKQLSESRFQVWVCFHTECAR